jgi:hypothetical protein
MHADSKKFTGVLAFPADTLAERVHQSDGTFLFSK